MRLLLDTHTLIWTMGASRKLPHSLHRLIRSPRNQIFFSVASLFEIAAKRAAGSRRAPDLAAEVTLKLAREAGFHLLEIAPEHAIAVETIALFHGDPVDRLLLAQAQMEGMRLVTNDEKLAAYDSRTILF